MKFSVNKKAAPAPAYAANYFLFYLYLKKKKTFNHIVRLKEMFWVFFFAKDNINLYNLYLQFHAGKKKYL